MIKNKHCCTLMYDFLDKDKNLGYITEVNIYYSKILREYYVGEKTKQVIFFCPWCGKKLPHGLRKEYCKVVKEKYGFEPNIYKAKKSGLKKVKSDLDMSKTLKLPIEFLTDKWWKKRGL